MKKSTNKGVRYNKQTKTKSKSSNSFKFDTSTIVLLVIAIAIILVLLKVIGPLFTIIMVVGIALILLLSKWVKKLRKKKKTRIIVNIILMILLLLCIAGCILAIVFIGYVIKKAPEFDVSQLERSESSILYDINNNAFAELGTEKREKITYDEMSQTFIDALIATEDSRFFQHNGFDAARFLKASIQQVLHSSGGGASTLSMQVIKNSFTDANLDEGFEGIVRKFTDIYLAVFKLEKTYSKQEIIEFYVNVHNMGGSAYGVEQASQTYFGKHASELNLAEASLLAGLFKSPNAYNPFKNLEAATKRRTTVLNLMVMHGYITKEERDMANSIPIESLLVENTSSSNKYQSYIDQVATEVKARYRVNIYSTPLLIYTNMDPNKQTGIDNIFNGTTYNWVDNVVQAGIAVVDVDTGKIVAIGTGRNKTGVNQWNYASGNKRQIGSTAKPLFDYGPGIEYNNWSPAKYFEDKEYYYSSGQPMRNSDRQYWGWMTLRDALAYSRNVPALQAFQSVDNKKIIEFVSKLGITPEVNKYGYIHEAHSIGAFTGSNALEMAGAYAAFANGGTYYEPYTVNKVVFRSTGREETYKPEPVEAMSDSTAFMITDVLKSAVSYGLSSAARVNGVNVAAKTGTTNYPEDLLRSKGYPTDIISDSWIVGYDPEYAIGMWYGYPKLDATYNLKQSVAGVERGRLFRAAGEVVFAKNGQDFQVPSSVVKSAYEKWSSDPYYLPSENTPEDEIAYDYFKVGTEPTEVSTKYQKLKNVTNLLVKYNPSTMSVSLSWSKAAKQNPKDSYGNFGYKIYKDGTYLGFTEKAYFVINDEEDPYGEYKVVTTYEKYDKMDSKGAIYELKEDVIYSHDFLVPGTRTYAVNESLDSWDKNPSSSDLKFYKNKDEITKFKAVITIKNSKGETVGNITTNAKEEYTVTYKISYNSKEVHIAERKVIIE